MHTFEAQIACSPCTSHLYSRNYLEAVLSRPIYSWFTALSIVGIRALRHPQKLLQVAQVRVSCHARWRAVFHGRQYV